MDVRELVTAHYGAADLAESLLETLAGAGVDIAHLTAPGLAPVDHLHAGGLPATTHLLDQLGLSPGARLLDVGSGVGGPAREAAARGMRVTGVDLTPEFVDTAITLTERVGLAHQARFLTTAGEELPFEDDSFDAAMMIHVGMNLPDKTSVFSEVHRVLVPGGRFGLFEQMRTGAEDLPFPMPWADDERTSFVESPEQYAEHLARAGFTVELLDNRDRAIAATAPPSGALSPETLFGPVFAERIGNNMAAFRNGLLSAFVLLARA